MCLQLLFQRLEAEEQNFAGCSLYLELLKHFDDLFIGCLLCPPHPALRSPESQKVLLSLASWSKLRELSEPISISENCRGRGRSPVSSSAGKRGETSQNPLQPGLILQSSPYSSLPGLPSSSVHNVPP